VRAGSWFHQTECFGPVLGVMRADDLDHALAIQNGVPFGLTGGIHALDEAEIAHWLERVEVGNAYVNRHITGAIVRRQPFGGWKRSSIGPGAKTGGPRDVARFVRGGAGDAGAHAAPDDHERSYRRWWRDRYGVAIDRSGLRSERNVLRYRPLRSVAVRTGVDTAAADVASVRRAAAIAGVDLTVVGPGTADAELAEGVGRFDRLRLLAPVSDALRAAAHAADVAVDDTPVTGDGRVELPCWVREQAISRSVHRHGRVGRLQP
jgi:RHH-type proline utilization regulon transcriptional repressor/proline dehydrogenase/delta 1-pyrroline-5-carboxylate dehydrogenase